MAATASIAVLIVGVIVLAIPVVALVMLIAGIVMLARSRRQAGASGEGNCGKCGYLVAGLSTFVCPECGADLRVAGIVAPRKSRGLAIAMVAVGGAGLLLACAGFFGLFFVGLVMRPAPRVLTIPAPRAPGAVQMATPTPPPVVAPPPSTAQPATPPPPDNPVAE